MFGTDRTVSVIAFAFAVLFFAFEGLYFPVTRLKDFSLVTASFDVVELSTYCIYFAASFYLFVLFIQAAIACVHMLNGIALLLLQLVEIKFFQACFRQVPTGVNFAFVVLMGRKRAPVA